VKKTLLERLLDEPAVAPVQEKLLRVGPLRPEAASFFRKQSDIFLTIPIESLGPLLSIFREEPGGGHRFPGRSPGTRKKNPLYLLY